MRLKNKYGIQQIIFLLFFLALEKSLLAQFGCTDPEAKNYNLSAISNDGSCLYDISYQSINQVRILPSKLNESSGVILTDGYLWSHNDSGNKNEIYKIDTLSGIIIQTLIISNAINIDWEDITADEHFIYIGDFGNNNGVRTDLNILKINKSQFINFTDSIISVTAEYIYFSYLDQTDFSSRDNHNFDCEAIISIKDSLYLFTKNRADFQTKVYKLPKVTGSYNISPYTQFNINGLITGADYNPISEEIVLIGYSSSLETSFLFYLSDYQKDLFFSGNKRQVELENSLHYWLTEGITYSTTKKLYITCESFIIPATLYSSLKSSISQASISESTQKKNFSIFPNPILNVLTLESQELIKSIKIIDLIGNIVLSKQINQFNISIFSSEFTSSNGYFYITIETINGIYHQSLEVTSNH